MEKAKEATSLSDFGEDSFLEGLEVLVKALNAEGRLSEMGRYAIEMQLVGPLTWRLQIEDWYRRHPEIDEQEIVKPLIGLGLPPTGSTALSFMLAEDPAVRSIRNWEGQFPCPPPETATEHTDPRIALTEQSGVMRDQMWPRLKLMLPNAATGPVECQSFMGYDFKSQMFQAMATIPSYVDWLNHKADLVPTYRYVKRVLKLLQWRCPPNRWRLKNPAHSLFIDALDKVFPDARYWMTHRDINSVLPSVADIYYEFTRSFSDDVDKALIARKNADWTELGLRRLIAFRDKGNDNRFFDIHFGPFQKDPFPILKQLYDFLGEELTDEAVARMKAWREAEPRDKHGSITYDASEFDIDLAAESERFRFYTERFNVQPAKK
jgi:hypothetical protein